MKYLALLRGINVGGNAAVKMPQLKAMFESLGYTDVSTFINSGNVIFSSNQADEHKMSRDIEGVMEKEFGLVVKTIVRSQANILEVSKAISDDWHNNADQKTDILFLYDEADSQDILNKITYNLSVDSLVYVAGAIVWHIERKNYNESGMHKFIQNPLYKKVTARNCNTIRKLAELIA